jgi:membrane protein YqaA with SNARE-associated domain
MPPRPFDDMLNGIGNAAASASKQAQQAANSMLPAMDQAADRATAYARGAMNASVEQLTLWGRMVERAWRYFQVVSNPPWTARKVLGWAAAVLVMAAASILYHEVHLGVLGLPFLESLGAQFIAWAASLGPIGLFVFTAISTLFFLFLPTEPFFFLALAGSPDVVVPVIAASLGSTVGSLANYGFGIRLRHRSVKKKGDHAKLGKWGARARSKYGTVILFLAGSLPVPEIVAVGYGLADYPLKKFSVVTLGARFAKWTWITLAYVYLRATF